MADLIKKIRTNSGDLQIDYNALANLPTISNPNLLINSDFRNPVNQRGQTTVSTTVGNWTKTYCIDRWYIQNGVTANVQNGYIKLSSSSSNTSEGYFCQLFEHALANDTYTITINVKNVGSGSTVYFKSGTNAYGKALVAGLNVITVSMSLSSLEIQLHPNSTIELYWIKLERGSTSTAFVPKLYAQEVADCQRYYTKSDGVRLQVIHGTNHLYITVPLTAALRTDPNVTFGATQIKVLYDGDGDSKSYDVGDCYATATNTHVVLHVNGSYGVSVYKIGSVADSLPIYIDAELY